MVRKTISPGARAVHIEEVALPPVRVVEQDVRQWFGNLVDEVLVHGGQGLGHVSGLPAEQGAGRVG